MNVPSLTLLQTRLAPADRHLWALVTAFGLDVACAQIKGERQALRHRVRAIQRHLAGCWYARAERVLNVKVAAAFDEIAQADRAAREEITRLTRPLHSPSAAV